MSLGVNSCGVTQRATACERSALQRVFYHSCCTNCSFSLQERPCPGVHYLTSVLCKLREQLVTDRFTWHMELNHRFNRFKSGLHRLQSCQEHIVRLQDDIQRAIHTKYSLTGVLVDLENAFNTMDCCTSDHCDYCTRPYCDRWTAGRQSRSMMAKPRGCS